MSLRCAVLMLLAALSAAAAQGDPSPFCAFEVFVKSPSGVPVAGAYVVETEQGGALFDTQNTDEKGVARFCDAPMFGLVSFNVGGKMCGAVSVEYLDPSWFETTQVFITYERCPGVCFSLPGRCLVLLRVRDTKGDPLAGVAFRTVPDEAAPPPRHVSDNYGRVFLEIQYGDILRGALWKAGWTPQPISEKCVSGGESVRNETRMMQPAR